MSATRAGGSATVGGLRAMLTIHDTRNDFASTPCTIAVLPVGAIEQHGRHLPVGTDLLLEAADQNLYEEKRSSQSLIPRV